MRPKEGAQSIEYKLRLEIARYRRTKKRLVNSQQDEYNRIRAKKAEIEHRKELDAEIKEVWQ